MRQKQSPESEGGMNSWKTTAYVFTPIFRKVVMPFYVIPMVMN